MSENITDQIHLFPENGKHYITNKRKLLPWWIKVFIWIFLFLAVFTPVVIILGFLGYKMQLSLYGIQTSSALSSKAFLITGLFLFKGVVSYGLWTGKKWAIKVAMIDAVFGILFCLYMMFLVKPVNEKDYSNYRFELVFLIPYFVKLTDLIETWNKAK